MKNLTISMSEDVLHDVRVEAAKAGKSVSKYVADILEQNIRRPASVRPTTRESQMKALERILSGPKWNVMRGGRMPTADERNER